MIAYVSVLVMLLGVVVYYVATHAKVAEIGRIAFFCGLLVLLLTMANQTVSLAR